MIDHPFYQALQEHLVKHAEAYTEGLIGTVGAISIAAVCTMPKVFPTNFQQWWMWFRETCQTAVPAARRHDPEPPPVNPPQESK